MGYYIQKPIDDRGDSLEAPRLRGKDRARKALIMAEEEQQAILQEIIDNCKNGINVLQNIRHSAEFELRTGKFHGWNSLGEEQGNAARHVDATVGRVYQNTQYIKLLHDVLEIPIEQRSTHERKQDQEQARPEGAEEQEPQAEEEHELTEGDVGQRDDVRGGARGARARTGRGAGAPVGADQHQGGDGGQPVEGSEAGARTRKRSSRVAKK